MRLPVAQSLESRDGTLAKDAKLKNCVVEIIEGKATAVKRPGVTNAAEMVGGGMSQGLIWLNGITYAVVSDGLYLWDFGPWKAGFAYPAGSAVSYGSGSFYWKIGSDENTEPPPDEEEEPLQVGFIATTAQINAARRKNYWSKTRPGPVSSGWYNSTFSVGYNGYGSSTAAAQGWWDYFNAFINPAMKHVAINDSSAFVINGLGEVSITGMTLSTSTFAVGTLPSTIPKINL